MKHFKTIIDLEVFPALSTKKEQPLCHRYPIKCMCRCKLCVASCQSKFAIHEVMNCVANLKVHLKDLTENELGHEKMCFMSYAKNKGADRPAHPRSLISAFVVRCLDSMISLDSIAEISRL